MNGVEPNRIEEKDMSPNGHLLKSIASLLLAGALAAPQAWAVEGAAADARAAAPPLSLVVIEGMPGSEALLRGDYESGLAELLAAHAAAPERNVVPLASNICAAQVKLAQYAQAAVSCERAVGGPAAAGSTGAEARLLQAAALVNRGVLRVLRGDAAGADADFDRAARRYIGLAVARSNLARMRSGERDGQVLVGRL